MLNNLKRREAMKQKCLALVVGLVFCFGVVKASLVSAEELTKEEIATLKEILKTKDISPEGELTPEELSTIKELVKERLTGAGEEAVPVEPTAPHVARVQPLTDDEVTGIRDFMTQFKGIKFDGFVESFYQYNTVDPGNGDIGTSGRRGSTPTYFRPNFFEVRSFDREDNSFTLNNIELHLYKEPTEDSPIGFRATTLYGEQAQRITFVPTDGRVDDDDFTVAEGYTWWRIPVGKGVDFKFGKFATWIGYEVWEAHWNPNWSRSLLYNNAIPFTNTGLSLGYPVTDNLYFTFFFVNGWDTFVDNNKGKTFGTQIKYNIPDMPILHNAFVVLNTSHGPEQSGKGYTVTHVENIPVFTPVFNLADPDLPFLALSGLGIGFFDADFTTVTSTGGEGNWRHFFDFILQFEPTEWLRLNTNVDFGTEQFERGFAGGFGPTIFVGDGRLNRKWWGVSQVVHLFPQRRINVAFRGEYFWDKDAARNVVFVPLSRPSADAQAGVSLAEFTATLNIKVREKLWIRPEVRYDKIVSAPGPTSAELFDNHNKNISFATAFTYEF